MTTSVKFVRLILLLTATLLCGCRTAEPEGRHGIDVEMVLEGVIAVLDGKIDLQALAPREREILRRLEAVSFDPFPFASHRIYLDRITDFQTGSVTRTYYDYGGNESHYEEVTLHREELIGYVRALAFFQVRGFSATVVPDIVCIEALSQGVEHGSINSADE